MEEEVKSDQDVDFLKIYLQQVCSPILFAGSLAGKGQLDEVLQVHKSGAALNKFAVNGEIAILVVELTSEGGKFT